jgi:selenium-binding protein 1
MVKNGINPVAARRQTWKQAARVGYGAGGHLQELDLGAEQQMVLELRPAHDPTRAYGFAGVVVSLKDLSSSVWLWYRDPTEKPGQWAIKKVIEVPAEPADPEKLPPLLQGFKAVPPLVTDIELSVDDRYLYVSCWGLGEFIQYDVTDPFNPKKVSSLKLGGMVNRTGHPSKPGKPVNGGPQMVEVSRDGRRIYFTNSLYTPWDRQIYPDGIQGWIAKADIPANGGPMKLDPNFFIETGGLRPHQIRLEGGDASSDSYCYA